MKRWPLKVRVPVGIAAGLSFGLAFWPWLVRVVLFSLSGWRLSTDGVCIQMGVGMFLGLAMVVFYFVIENESAE